MVRIETLRGQKYVMRLEHIDNGLGHGVGITGQQAVVCHLISDPKIGFIKVPRNIDHSSFDWDVYEFGLEPSFRTVEDALIAAGASL